MSYGNNSRRIKNDELRVDPAAREGWSTGQECAPRIGQHVYCTHGMAEVIKLLDKTSNGSRLLELKLLDQTGPPFFAAASNVLVAPEVEQAGRAASA